MIRKGEERIVEKRRNVNKRRGRKGKLRGRNGENNSTVKGRRGRGRKG